MILSDRVKEILNKYYRGDYITDEEAVNVILQAFREVVPEKKETNLLNRTRYYFKGWNAYHDALMERIK